MKIIIAGGSGQVGTILARHFHQNGHSVVVLSRRLQKAPWRVVHWDGSTLGPWLGEIDCSDVLINLAGRSVNCRYTQKNRREILESRVLSTRVLHQGIARMEYPPAVWLNASTATIYRHALDRPMDEATGEFGGNEMGAPNTWNFSIQVAKAWEEAFFSAVTPGTRQVALRSAMTFSADRGGVFDVFLNLVRHGLGGTTLPGTQFVSWIHEADFIRSVEFLIKKQEITGAVNLASPHPLPNREFLGVLRKTWGTRFGLPTTRWMLELGTFLMRTESELILKSRQVVPGRLLDAGFQFEYPTWPQAAQDLVAQWRKANP
ncbi:TIGR01777 family protein [Terriglobus albidus]|uniref:TIGR01777 family protein n=1 Tax=Terriglobus albidus TaxID=1592106 RepID=A0A5B9E8K5_9BACT|nr:TIGR01777 family oxidoreductase [Terriglobus albidus]QEE27944.1 TIGR01777 family protein [Terriglobus albidus]